MLEFIAIVGKVAFVLLCVLAILSNIFTVFRKLMMWVGRHKIIASIWLILSAVGVFCVVFMR